MVMHVSLLGQAPARCLISRKVVRLATGADTQFVTVRSRRVVGQPLVAREDSRLSREDQNQDDGGDDRHEKGPEAAEPIAEEQEHGAESPS
jgi:hypothetical protein